MHTNGHSEFSEMVNIHRNNDALLSLQADHFALCKIANNFAGLFIYNSATFMSEITECALMSGMRER